MIPHLCCHLSNQDDSSSESDEDSDNAKIEQKEYEVEELSELLENAQREQKELFLILFQVRFRILYFQLFIFHLEIHEIIGIKSSRTRIIGVMKLFSIATDNT